MYYALSHVIVQSPENFHSHFGTIGIHKVVF